MLNILEQNCRNAENSIQGTDYQYLLGLLITCFIVWIVKTTAVSDNQRPPKPLGDKGIKLNAILRDCGQLCDTSRKGPPGPYFDHVTAPFDCMALFKNVAIECNGSIFFIWIESSSRLGLKWLSKRVFSVDN